MKRYLWIAGSVFLVIAISLGLAAILPPREQVFDFIMLYSAGLGIIHHVPLYDNPAITHLAITQLNLLDDFSLFPYPYPPWYALSTFYLAFLPLDRAAMAWTLLNTAILLTSAMLLTDRWKPFPRILVALATLIFIPSLGLIVVGQYSAPVLLGAALFLYAARREDTPLSALGLLLMTFKPHIGLFLLPIGFLWLVFQRTPFARRTIWMALGGGVALAVIGFLADPAWPMTYIRSLLSYTTVPGVANRDLSASFSAFLVKLALGYGNGFWATWVSVVLIVIMLALFWRFKIFTYLETLVVGCALMTLLGDPYMFNYDYVLMILPLVCLAASVKNIFQRLILVLAYIAPWTSFLWQREANIIYAMAAIGLLAILLRETRKRNRADLVPSHEMPPSS